MHRVLTLRSLSTRLCCTLSQLIDPLDHPEWCDSNISGTAAVQAETEHPTTPPTMAVAPQHEGCVIHPFTGRSVKKASIRHLLDVGFVVDDSNPYRLKLGPDFRPEEFIKKAAKKNMAEWQREACEILQDKSAGVQRLASRMEDVYRQVCSAQLPAKLESLYDPVLEEMTMTKDQDYALKLALEGVHLYIGGSAGTGKTMLLKAISRELGRRGARVAMTATTGVAAVQVGGLTFHHAFGVPMTPNGKWDLPAL